MREAYRDTLMPKAPSGAATEMASLRAQLFGAKSATPVAPGLAAPLSSCGPAPRFEPQFAGNAREAVDLVAANLARGVRFSTIFLDMRMPPGENGLWAAEHIRHLDAEVDIVICSAYSDVDPATVIERVPPADRLFFLQKPFHPHEVRQLARALGAKRSAQAHVHRLAYFDRPDRARQSRELPRIRRQGPAARAAGRWRRRGAVHRPGPLQAHQRHAGPSRGRRSAARSGSCG